MNNRTGFFTRTISSFLIAALFCQQIGYAAEIKPQMGLLAQTMPALELPRSTALIEDSYQNQLPSLSSKTVILIQDAHTNASAQLNLSKALDAILLAQKIKYVFLEAGTGDDSLSYLRPSASNQHKKSVAESYLKNGELNGAEYLDLVSDHNFTLWGVEDKALYRQSIDVYRSITVERERLRAYLGRVEQTVQTLKPKIFNASLLSFDKKRDAYLRDEMPLTDYFGVLMSEASKWNLPLKEYPHLQALRHLTEKEQTIDFKKATLEQREAVGKIGAQKISELMSSSGSGDGSPFKISSSDHKEAKAFYALLEERIKDLGSYPELSKYLSYLRESESIDPKALLGEQKKLEESVYAALVRTEDEAALRRTGENLRPLGNLLDLTLTPDEFGAYRREQAAFDIVSMTGFLNRKIMELGGQYERVVFLEKDYGNIIRLAERFYDLTYDRDQAIVKNMLAQMESSGQSNAVLITGGYHTPNLKQIFRQQGISYLCVTPQVLHETDHKRYEKILFGRQAGLSARPRSIEKDTLATLPIKESAAFGQFVERFEEPGFAAASTPAETAYALAASRLASARTALKAFSFSLLIFGIMSLVYVSNEAPRQNNMQPINNQNGAVLRGQNPPVNLDKNAALDEERRLKAVLDELEKAKAERPALLEAFKTKVNESESLFALDKQLPALIQGANMGRIFPEAAKMIKDRAAALLPQDEEKAKTDKTPAADRETARLEAIREATKYGALEEKDLKGVDTLEKALALKIRVRADYEASNPEVRALINQIDLKEKNSILLQQKAQTARQNADNAWRRAAADWSLSVRLRDSQKPQSQWPKSYTDFKVPEFKSTAPKDSKEYKDDEAKYHRELIALMRSRSAYIAPTKGRLGRDYLPFHAAYLPQHTAFAREKGGKIVYYDSLQDVPEKVRGKLELFNEGPSTGYSYYDRDSGTLYGLYLDWRIETETGELLFGIIKLVPTETKVGLLKQNLEVYPGPAYKKGADKELDALLQALKDGKAKTVMASIVDEAEIKRLNDAYDEYFDRLDRMNKRLRAQGFRAVQIPPPNFKIEDELAGPKQEKTGRKLAWFTQSYDPQSHSGGAIYLAYPTLDATKDFSATLLNGRSEDYKIYRKGIYKTGSQQTLGDKNLDYTNSAIVESAVFGRPGNLRISYMANALDPQRAAEAMERMSMEGGVWIPAPGIDKDRPAQTYLYPMIPIIGREKAKEYRDKLTDELLKELNNAKTADEVALIGRQLKQLGDTGSLLRPNGERYLIISNPEDVEEDARIAEEAQKRDRKRIREIRDELERERKLLPGGARLASAAGNNGAVLSVAAPDASLNFSQNRLTTVSGANNVAANAPVSGVAVQTNQSVSAAAAAKSANDITGNFYTEDLNGGLPSATVAPLDSAEIEAVKTFILEVLTAQERETLGKSLALRNNSGFANVLKISERKDIGSSAVEIRIRGIEAPIVIAEPAAELRARRASHPKADQEKEAARGFLALLKMDRMETERAIQPLNTAEPFGMGIPLSLLKNVDDPLRFEAAVRLLITQALELKSSPRYSHAIFFFNPAGLSPEKKMILEGLVDSNAGKGHPFLRIGDPSDRLDAASQFQGVLVKFVDSGETGGISRDGRTITLPVSADNSSFFFWSKLFVIGQATAAVYARPGVFDKDKQQIDDKEVDAADLSNIMSVYNKNAASPLPDTGRFILIMRSEKDSGVFKIYAFRLPPIDKIFLDSIMGIARVALQAVGGAA